MLNRTWKTLAVAALLGPSLAIVGCKHNDHGHDHDHDHNHDTVALAEPVTILESKSGSSDAFKTIGRMLIKTQADYDALGKPDLHPGIDFEANDLVIVALGEQPTGGYAIEITAIQEEGDTLFVVGSSSEPGEDAVVTQALTYPFAAAVIPNTSATLVVPQID